MNKVKSVKEKCLKPTIVACGQVMMYPIMMSHSSIYFYPLQSLALKHLQGDIS